MTRNCQLLASYDSQTPILGHLPPYRYTSASLSDVRCHTREDQMKAVLRACPARRKSGSPWTVALRAPPLRGPVGQGPYSRVRPPASLLRASSRSLPSLRCCWTLHTGPVRYGCRSRPKGGCAAPTPRRRLLHPSFGHFSTYTRPGSGHGRYAPGRCAPVAG